MPSAAVAQGSPQGGRKWIFGHCEYLEARRQLIVSGKPVAVEAKPLDVLQYLLERPGAITPSKTLLDEVWQDASVSDQSVTTAIRKLRVAFGGERDSIILNVSRVGYSMAVPVTCVPVTEPLPQALCLQPGDRVPGREDYIVDEALDLPKPHAVWLAHQQDTKEVRVFKFASDGIHLRALQRELTLSRIFAQKLRGQPGFARIHSSNFDRSPYFIESEYGGPNLYQFSQTDQFRGLSISERLALTLGLIEAIAASHRVGILHNDLKPANILVAQRADASGPTWRVTVVDFGVASLTDTGRLLAMQMTHHGAFENQQDATPGGSSVPKGTPLYWAPELRTPGATPDVLTDVYALGLLVYQILTGDFADTLSPGWETRIPDPLLRADIAEAAHVDPRLRTQTAEALAEKLRTLNARREADERRREQQARQEEAEQKAIVDRQRRRFAVMVAAALLVILCVTLWSYRRVSQALQLANQRSATLQSLNQFLSEDLLKQSNPLLGTGRASVRQETLVDAIQAALPQIDRRFSSAPVIAGQLHETIAAALDAQTRYEDAEQEFRIAAQRFRQANGPLSEDAIGAELRSINTALRSRDPLRTKAALTRLDEQQKKIGELGTISAQLQAWNALALSGSQLVGGRNVNSVSVLENAIRAAEATPGFSPSLRRALLLRLCPVYLSLGRPADAERAARQVVDEIRAVGGPQSRELFEAETFLQEALHKRAKYADALALAKANGEQLTRSVGLDNQLTLANLFMQAEDEGALGDYSNAIRDDLALYQIAAKSRSGGFNAENSLLSAAAFECHSGRFAEGLEHARQAMVESGPNRYDLPAFVEVARYQEADCLISEQEAQRRPNSEALGHVAKWLAGTDVDLVKHTLGLETFVGTLDLARARLAVLHGRREEALEYLERATPFIQRPDSEPYDKKEWSKLKGQLSGLASRGDPVADSEQLR